MKIALTLMLVFLLAVLLGNLAWEDTGLVIIGYRDKLIQTNLAVFVVLITAAVAALYMLWRVLNGVLFAGPRLSAWYENKRRNRAHAALAKGYIALAEGDWNRAERALVTDASVSAVKMLHYLGAAYAAQQQQAPDRRDDYLSLAHESEFGSELAIGLTQAELQLQQGQLEQAEATLLRMGELKPKNARLLRMLAQLYAKRQQWEELLGIARLLSRSKAAPAREVQAFQTQAYQEILRQAAQHEPLRLDKAWERIPKALRQQPLLIKEYSHSLMHCQRNLVAEEVLRQALTKNWDADLVLTYGALETDDTLAQLTHAEAWLEQHPGDVDLIYTLGRLSHRAGLWAKARTYLESAIAQRPTAEGYWLLAATLDKMGETELGSRASREGLMLATGGTSMPVLSHPAGRGRKVDA